LLLLKAYEPDLFKKVTAEAPHNFRGLSNCRVEPGQKSFVLLDLLVVHGVVPVALLAPMNSGDLPR